MKTRQGFVSNSSSSSFMLDRKYVDRKQLDHIVHHIMFSKRLPAPEYSDGRWFNHEGDAWEITVEEDHIYGWTNMDNFNMRHFLHEIGILDEAIEWRS